MGDPFRNYFALFLLFFVVFIVFYSIIAVHDIPYRIAQARDYHHQDAIHAVGWVSLFTLHALWPFLWTSAMAYRLERGWGFSEDFANRSKTDRALALIDLDENTSKYQIPLSASAEVAIYTEYRHDLSLLRKILIRMRSWQKYVFSEEHSGLNAWIQ